MSPHILNQVILQLNVSFSIMHLMMKLDELCKHCRSTSMLRHNIVTLELKHLIVDTFRTLILYNHIMHDHTSSHHLPQLLGAPSSSRILNDASSRLKNTKSTLHIPSTLLCLSKSLPLLSYRVGDCLHKSSPLRIDTISQVVVSFVVVVAIDLNIDLWAVAFCKPSEHQRTPKHVCVIVIDGHAEKRVPNLEIW